MALNSETMNLILLPKMMELKGIELCLVSPTE